MILRPKWSDGAVFCKNNILHRKKNRLVTIQYQKMLSCLFP